MLMAEKKSFILHIDSLCILNKMTNEQAGILFKAIFEYQLTGQIPELDFAMDMAFTPFLNQFIRDDEKYNGFKAKQIENGKKGGRPKKGEVIIETQQNPKNPSLFSETQKSLNDSVSVNDSISKNKNESKNKSVSKTQPHLFSESEFCDFGKFESAFIGTDYEVADLRLYFELVKNWSESKGAKKLDWIATARNFMLSDLKENKLKYKNGTTSNQQSAISDKERRAAELAAESERRRSQQ